MSTRSMLARIIRGYDQKVLLETKVECEIAGDFDDYTYPNLVRWNGEIYQIGNHTNGVPHYYKIDVFDIKVEQND